LLHESLTELIHVRKNNRALFSLSFSDLMRGYCAKCQEYRSDNGLDAWGIIWRNDLAICERCGSVVDVWVNDKCKEESIQKMEDQRSIRK